MNVIYTGAAHAYAQEMSLLIAAQNSEVRRHVGYCGIDAAEIRRALENDFEDERLERDFTLALLGGKVVGVLGFDLDPDTGVAEMWGPFADWEDGEFIPGCAGIRAELIDGLWKAAMARASGEIARLQGFYHRENAEAESLMLRAGASLKGQHLTLALRREKFRADTRQAEKGIFELGAEFGEAFERLHDGAFPGSYATGAALLAELDGERRLLGCVREGKLLGYAFVSGSRDFAEGDVEFLAAAPEVRGRGIGSALLQAALNLLFAEFSPAEVRLTVSAANAAAIGLYRKCGFRTREELDVYELAVPRGSADDSLDFLWEQPI